MKKVILTSMTLALVALILIPTTIMAQSKPVQLALFAPVQLFPENTAISGIRLSLIYGKNTSVTGLDWGLINRNTSGMSMGVQWGFVNLNDASFMGWQDGFVNITSKDFQGLQWGFVNSANNAKGLQLGFVNYTRTLKGLQIGFINIIKQGGQFPVFPIVNWSF